MSVSVTITSDVFMWWPRTVPKWVKSGNSMLLLRRARVGCAGSGSKWIVRGHDTDIKDDIETESHPHFHMRPVFSFLSDFTCFKF